MVSFKAFALGLALFVLLALPAVAAKGGKAAGSCSVTPMSAGAADGTFIITATANVGFDFYVQHPDGVRAYWALAQPGEVVSYPYPPAPDYYPLQVGDYTVVVQQIGKGHPRAIASCSLTVLP